MWFYTKCTTFFIFCYINILCNIKISIQIKFIYIHILENGGMGGRGASNNKYEKYLLKKDFMKKSFRNNTVNLNTKNERILLVSLLILRGFFYYRRPRRMAGSMFVRSMFMEILYLLNTPSKLQVMVTQLLDFRYSVQAGNTVGAASQCY